MDPRAITALDPLSGSPYPQATTEQRLRFGEDGFLVVANAIPAADLRELHHAATQLIAHTPAAAKDWDWRAGEARNPHRFRIVSCGIYEPFPALRALQFLAWMQAFAQSLMGRELSFWYHQFLGKPPGIGAPTPWHQDEAYWGRNLRDRGITCWVPLHEVNPGNGCMHFIPGVHQQPVRQHCNPTTHASDLLVTAPEAQDQLVACPMRAGSVTFHHSNTPHMTTANSSAAWRLCIAHHFAVPGHCAEGGSYPWRVYVDHRTGERTAADN